MSVSVLAKHRAEELKLYLQRKRDCAKGYLYAFRCDEKSNKLYGGKRK